MDKSDVWRVLRKMEQLREAAFNTTGDEKDRLIREYEAHWNLIKDFGK